jgi:hypothetical protein
VHKLLSTKASKEEVKHIVEAKIDFREVETDILTLNTRIDDI